MNTFAISIATGDHFRRATIEQNLLSASYKSSTVFRGYDYDENRETPPFFGTGMTAWRRALEFIAELF